MNPKKALEEAVAKAREMHWLYPFTKTVSSAENQRRKRQAEEQTTEEVVSRMNADSGFDAAAEMEADASELRRAYWQACTNLATIRPDLSRDLSIGETAQLYHDALLAGWGGIEGYDPAVLPGDGGGASADTLTDAHCSQCDRAKADAPTEHVVQGEVEQAGWKCVCGWWNWLAGDGGGA